MGPLLSALASSFKQRDQVLWIPTCHHIMQPGRFCLYAQTASYCGDHSGTVVGVPSARDKAASVIGLNCDGSVFQTLPTTRQNSRSRRLKPPHENNSFAKATSHEALKPQRPWPTNPTQVGCETVLVLGSPEARAPQLFDRERQELGRKKYEKMPTVTLMFSSCIHICTGTSNVIHIDASVCLSIYKSIHASVHFVRGPISLC